MLTKAFSPRLLLAGVVGSLALGAAPSQATIVIDTTSGTSTNSAIQTFSKAGKILTLSNSNSTGKHAGTINSTSTGLCAWTAVGTSGGSLGRCGYGTNSASGVSSFRLSLNSDSFITGFNIAGFESNNLSQGTVSFSTDNINFTPLTFSGNGLQSLNFLAKANQTIFIQTSASFKPSVDTGIYRISSFTVADVPGPLPVLGAAAAFGWSRKLKRKVLS